MQKYDIIIQKGVLVTNVALCCCLYAYASLLVVTYRNTERLIPIIEKHVVAGSVIYTDGWKDYFPLEDKRLPVV